LLVHQYRCVVAPECSSEVRERERGWLTLRRHER
jgi:hypothetical protein